MRLLRFLPLLVLLMICSGPGQTQSEPKETEATGSGVAYWQLMADSLISTSREYLGLPYRKRIPEGKILDCSGYVSHVFSRCGIELSGSASAMKAQVNTIPIEEVRPGDLLFFKGRNIQSKSVGHVSMVVGKSEDRIRMIHSCRRGILEEEFPRPYYKERFLFAGRVPVLQKPSPGPIPPTKPHTEQDTTLTIAMVGDLMLGSNHPAPANLPPNDGKDLLKAAVPQLTQADLTFGNLEGVLMTGPGPVKQCRDPKVCWAFKSPDHFVNNFVEAGFDVMSTANNHVGDFGAPGRASTQKVLKSAGIAFAGLLDKPYEIFTKDGITYGFCAFAPNGGTMPINDYERMAKVVHLLDSLTDVVIVSFHGGGEGSAFSHITRKTEVFLGENRGNPYEFARKAIDAGADVVIGHGPHVPRAVDLYKGRFIVYSLGNFATYRFGADGPKGLAPLVCVDVDKNGVFRSGRIISFRQDPGKGPQPDPNMGAWKEMKKLTESDVPECGLEFTEDGGIRIKSNP